jgi:putative IMPACT (imprinted ancient) family translation regulator
MPIIECMRARGVVDACVVVVRYFGGVLLGAGGLTRAYAQGAKTALDAARVITMEDSAQVWIGVEYPLWGRVEHRLAGLPVKVEGTEFGATVTATVWVRERDAGFVKAEMERVTDGKAEWLEVERAAIGWEEN